MTGVRTTEKRWVALVIAALVVLIDRVTKLWVEAHVPLGHTIVVIPSVFRISHVLNTGAAFSLFGESSSPDTVRYALIGFSLVAAVGICVALWRMGRIVTLTSVALSLILGGAIGNLYDRWKFHYVVDFLQVHIVHYPWPDFNAADSAIVIGACLLFFEVLRPQRSA